MDDKKLKAKILKGSNNIFAGYCKKYSEIILQTIIENPRITKEGLAYYKFKSKGNYQRKIPSINNEYIAQKYIDYVKKEVKNNE